MFYFRVFEDGESKLFNRAFQAADDGEPQASDFVISVSRKLYDQIQESRPGSVYVRVHEDRHDRDLGKGVIFDENLARVRPHEVTGNPVLLAITPDEFDAALAMRP